MQHKPITEEISEQQHRGVLLILTGPSGSGKDTVIAKLAERDPTAIKVITTTSRSMREIEREGEPYYFIKREEFEQLIANEAFFEWVEFRGELYGTQKKTLMDAIDTGKNVIWKIEAKGVKNIKDKIKQMLPRSVFVYLTAPSIAVLKQRVFAVEGEERAHLRWNESLVVWEMKQYQDSEYLVVNEDDKLDTAVTEILSIVEAKRREVLTSEKLS
ncbi:guanylate kinase [soil metagenome]